MLFVYVGHRKKNFNCNNNLVLYQNMSMLQRGDISSTLPSYAVILSINEIKYRYYFSHVAHTLWPTATHSAQTSQLYLFNVQW
jgi:hypothetical protein